MGCGWRPDIASPGRESRSAAPEGRWDLSPFAEVLLDVKNVGPEAIDVYLRVNNPGVDGVRHCVTGRVALEPGQRRTSRIALSVKPLFGMRGYPENYGEKLDIDPALVNQVIVFLAKPQADHVFEIISLSAAGSAEKAKAEEKTFFPLIDTFGQYVHKDWPGKTHSLAELREHRRQEESDLAAHPGPGRLGPVRRLEGRPAVEGHGTVPHGAAAGKVVAGGSRGPSVLVARRGLRGCGHGGHPDHRSPQLVCRPAGAGLAAGPVLRPRRTGPRTAITRAAATRPSTSPPPTCSASTATRGSESSTNRPTGGCGAGA